MINNSLQTTILNDRTNENRLIETNSTEKFDSLRSTWRTESKCDRTRWANFFLRFSNHLLVRDVRMDDPAICAQVEAVHPSEVCALFERMT